VSRALPAQKAASHRHQGSLSWLDRTGAGVVRRSVVPAADGSTDFAVLQNELNGQSTKIVLVAIDLLYLMGVALRRSSMAVDARLRILRRRDRDDVSADRDVAQ
jgi:hypothetical protein